MAVKQITKSRYTPKFHVKKGDKVKVIAGSSKGSEGIIVEMLTKENRAIVESVNMVKKHVKPVNDNPGGIIDVEAPIHLSNLMLVEPKSGKPTRTGRKSVDGKSVRYSKTTGEIIK